MYFSLNANFRKSKILNHKIGTSKRKIRKGATLKFTSTESANLMLDINKDNKKPCNFLIINDIDPFDKFKILPQGQ